MNARETPEEFDHRNRWRRRRILLRAFLLPWRQDAVKRDTRDYMFDYAEATGRSPLKYGEDR